MAYYTTDADDALATAQSMSKQWMEQGKNMEKNKQAGNDQAQETPARDRVYDIPNGYRDSAETMFRRLQHQGFTPEWDMWERKGQFMLGINMIPQNETNQLRELQKSNPATWGNHPDVEAMLDKNKQEMEAASEIRRAQTRRADPDQREFIEVLHQQSKDVLHVDAALDVNDKLHELAAQHHRLAQISLSESGQQAQERVQDEVEKEIVLLAQEIPGVLEPGFMYDPRGTTVGLMFESGATTASTAATRCRSIPSA